MTDPRPGRFALIGSGWRSAFFHRLARQAPDRFAVTGVITPPAGRGAGLGRGGGVPTYRSLASLVAAERREFVIVSVPWAQTAAATAEVAAAGIPVLAETPPAADLAGLNALWA